LVVEDDPRILKTLAEALVEQGHEVFRAANPVDAYRILENNYIDLVITDIDLGTKTSGAKLASEVAAAWPSVKLLAISGKPEREALPPGSLYLSKPFSLNELLLIIEQVSRSPKAKPSATKAEFY
jgi:DNA-binding response OmpR family regulator